MFLIDRFRKPRYPRVSFFLRDNPLSLSFSLLKRGLQATMKRRKIQPHRDANHLAESRSPTISLLVIATITKRVDKKRPFHDWVELADLSFFFLFFPQSPPRSSIQPTSRIQVSCNSSIVGRALCDLDRDRPYLRSIVSDAYSICLLGSLLDDDDDDDRIHRVYTCIYTRGSFN